MIGIVSYGIGCATKGVPGLYTRVSAYTGWIKEITKERTNSSAPFNLLNSKGQEGANKTATTPTPTMSTAEHTTATATPTATTR